jgi:Leucine-rich repeat (LRR) protein
MQATGIFVLPPDLFSNFQNLENLILRDNKIYIWKNGRTIFGNLTTLKHLDLGSNRINNIENNYRKYLDIEDFHISQILVGLNVSIIYQIENVVLLMSMFP